MHSLMSSNGSNGQSRLRSVLVLSIATALAAPAFSLAGGKSIQIVPLSSGGLVVTGGNAYVAILLPDSIAHDQVEVRLNGSVITEVFRDEPLTGQLRGLVSGLQLGENRLDVRGPDTTAQLTLVNHPITGPLLAGPQEQPFGCETDTFMIPVIGATLGPPLDDACSIVTRIDYIYKSTDGTFKPLTSFAEYPSDLARTVTLHGADVPYIVRIETGTINRAIYETSILFDPLRESPPDPFTRPAGWNGRLIYTFGGGCTSGWFRQGSSTGGVVDDLMLRQGYGIASASLNVFGNNCNDLLAAETMAMVKEHFIKTYGVLRYTIGFGCSGGSYQQHQIADNYPSLLDGIIPGCSFPEVGFATIHFITDARLLNHYFNVVAPGLFEPEQQRRVTGFLNLETMPNVSVGAGRISPFEFCPPPSVLPIPLRYDPITNPGGARCDVYDHTVNAYGRDPITNFARRPLDNVGIQYGLGALNDGVITVDQFLDLNERIGGYDKDANYIPQRTSADLDAVAAAYQTGRLTYAGNGLGQIPIIDYRSYNDDAPGGDIHVRYHSFTMRERLRKANGTADNQVMLVEKSPFGLYDTRSPVLSNALNQMDRWLDNLSQDTSGDPPIVKIVRAKPADLQEGCWTRDPVPVQIVEQQVRGAGQCEALYPSAPAPREVAGEPLVGDIIKCQLKVLDPADYRVSFSPTQWSRLQSIFKSGVCDYSRPGVSQQRPTDTWLFFN
jgi:hypothetical protein